MASEKLNFTQSFYVYACVCYTLAYYHPRMRVGNVLGHVCLCLVCLSVFLSLQAITFELHFWYAGIS